jgi:cell division control protein 6
LKKINSLLNPQCHTFFQGLFSTGTLLFYRGGTLAGEENNMTTITSLKTTSEATDQLQNLNDVQHLFDSILQANKLFTNRDLLRSTYIPETLPHREKEITELASILSPAMNLEAPSNVLLFGKPGVGKTAVVKHVGGELQKHGKALGKPIHILYVNAQMTDSLYKILTSIGQQLTSDSVGAIPSSGLPVDVILARIISGIDTKKQVIIIVLDEIDRIKDDAALYTLTRINEQLSLARISLIGISNNLKFTEFLDGRVKSSLGEENIIFNPYDAEQLQDILRDRIKTAIKPNVIDEDVIPLCAALSAQEHGDARRALDLLRVSVEIAERRHERIVAAKHVRLAQNKIEKDRILEVIRSLPAQQRLLLHAIRILQRYNEHAGKQSIMTTGEIYSAYTELSIKVDYATLSQRRIADFISELDSLGIVTARVISKGRHGQTREVKMTVPSAELDRILQDDEFMEELRHVKMKNQTKLL